MKKLISIFACFLFFSYSSYAQGWTKLGSGINGFNRIGENISSVCPDNRGNVYEAGWVTDTAWADSAFVDMWNGTSWAYVGAGGPLLPDSFRFTTKAITDTGGNVYMIGVMYALGCQNVVKWNGTSWNKVGVLNANSRINTICFDRYGNLYAAGAFTDSTTDTVGHTYIAKWDGTSWSELGAGTHALIANGEIITLCADTLGNVYAAGKFTNIGGMHYVAKWDGTSWSELGTGTHALNANGEILTACADISGNIYAAGYVTNTSGMYYVAKWDGTSWTESGAGSDALNANNYIISLCSDIYGNIYAAGGFTNTIGMRYVAKWDGTTWSELGTGSDALNANGDIMSISSDVYGNIYAGGVFTDTTVIFNPHYVAEYLASTGVAPIQKISGINVYPNPAANMISITGVQQNTIYCLLNVVDECVQQGNLKPGNNTITINNFVPGVYILEMTGADGERNMVRVVKE